MDMVNTTSLLNSKMEETVIEEEALRVSLINQTQSPLSLHHFERIHITTSIQLVSV